MGKEIHVSAPPPGFQVQKESKKRGIPQGSLPGRDPNGNVVSKVWYVPIGGGGQTPMIPQQPSYGALDKSMAVRSVHEPLPSYLPQQGYKPDAYNQYMERPDLYASKAQPQYHHQEQQQYQQQQQPQYQQQQHQPQYHQQQPQYQQQQPQYQQQQQPQYHQQATGLPVIAKGQYNYFNTAVATKTEVIFKEDLAMVDGGAQISVNGHNKFCTRPTRSIGNLHFDREIVEIGTQRVIARVLKQSAMSRKVDEFKSFGMAKEYLILATPQGTEICRFQEKRMQLGRGSEIVFYNQAKMDVSISMRVKKCSITDGGKEVFHFERKSGLTSMLTGKDTYIAKVPAGVDIAFASAIILMVEELQRGDG